MRSGGSCEITESVAMEDTEATRHAFERLRSAVLMEIGCDELQGYLFAKPMTAQALTPWGSDERPAEGRAGGFRACIDADTAPTPL